MDDALAQRGVWEALGQPPLSKPGPGRRSPARVALSLGLILGFRPEAGVIGVTAGLCLLLVFAFAISWIFTTIVLLASALCTAVFVPLTL